MSAFNHIKIRKPICAVAVEGKIGSGFNDSLVEAIVLALESNARVILDCGHMFYTIDPEAIRNSVIATAKEEL